MNESNRPDDKEKIARLLSVLEVTKEVAKERSFEQLMQLIVVRACDALSCERSSLFLYDKERGELYTRWVTELGIDEIRLPAEKGIVGLALNEPKPLFVDDPYSHPRFDPSFDKETGFKTRNILCVPLASWTDQRVLGVLQLLNKHNDAFDAWDQELLGAFAAHAAIAIERAILAKHYEEKTRLEVELNAARDVQASFFPAELPCPSDYEIVAYHQAADATGGDYYDVITLESGNLGLIVADVAGHGLGPSLLMASMRAMLRGVVVREERPHVVLSELNRALGGDLCPVHPVGGTRQFRFITVLYGTLDPQQHVFNYADAGHGPVTLHYKADEGRIQSLVDDPVRGGPLGIFTEPYQLCSPIHLGRGDLLVLGTDGVVETRRDGELFGMDRFCDMLLQHRRKPLAELLDELIRAATEFHQGPPSDDVTLMIVRRKEKGETAQQLSDG